MATNARTMPRIRDNDWTGLRRALNTLSKLSLGPEATPTFAGVIFTDLAPLRLIASDADKSLISSDLVNWVAGTANRISVIDDTDGTITLSGPQDIHAGASPTFLNLTLTGLTIDGTHDYILSTRVGGAVTLIQQTEDILSSFEIFTKKGDAGDEVGYTLYARGLPGAFTNLKALRMYYDGSTRYSIESITSGAGDALDISIFVGANTNQLLFENSGLVSTNRTNGFLINNSTGVASTLSMNGIGAEGLRTLTYNSTDAYFTFDGNLRITELTANRGVYTNVLKQLVSTRPDVAGDFGLWNFDSGVLSPAADTGIPDVELGGDLDVAYTITGNNLIAQTGTITKILTEGEAMLKLGGFEFTFPVLGGVTAGDFGGGDVPLAGLFLIDSNLFVGDAAGGANAVITVIGLDKDGSDNHNTGRMTIMATELLFDTVNNLNIKLDPHGTGTIELHADTNVSGIITATGGNSTEWNTSYDNMVTALAFNTGDGIIAITQLDSGTLTTDSLDGRYYTITELGSTSNELGASLIGIEDDISLYTATNVEDALEEVMDMITIETHVADSFEVGGDQVGTVTGIIENTQVINDGDELILNETTGGPNPNFVQTFEFSGITAGHEPNLIELHWYYSPVTTPHTISIQMYNYNTSTWDVIDNTTFVATGGTLTFSSITITDGGSPIVDYTSGGAARVRFSHDDNGISSHDCGIDYLAIKDDHGIGSGITDHGSLSGLQDDDHDPLYHTDGRAATWLAANHETTFTHADIATNTSASHAESHTIASHNDTTATGVELETLTDGSTTALHTHAIGYVDRGDAAVFDMREGDGSTDFSDVGDVVGTWYEYDLNSIAGVPIAAKAVLLSIRIVDNNVASNLQIRSIANPSSINKSQINVNVAGVSFSVDVITSIEDGKIAMRSGSGGDKFSEINTLRLVVKGWWL